MTQGIPLATYRLQLTADFGFDAAAAVVPYLKTLGITHLYASPFLKARSGSTHGYDIIDHNALNPELGGEAGFEHLSAVLKAHDLGLILDFVPNHMGVHFADNAWWLDVLEWGSASPHAAFFDIDWDTLPFRRRPGVLLPILGTSYGSALGQGAIELRYEPTDGSLSAWYYEHRLPISPNRYGEILQVVVNAANAGDSAAGKALLAIAAQYRGLTRPRRHEAPAMKAAIAAVDGGAEVIECGLATYRAGPERATETLLLHHLLERQHYRLADWRVATSDINYRRFFDVNSLAGLRVEHPATFQGVHRLVTRLIADDRLQGLRLDHIDGLRDPAGYCQRLRRLIRSAQPDPSQPFYLLVEKILGEGEALPRFAGVHGTTGYEILNTISHVLIDNKGLSELDEVWRQAADLRPDFDPVLLQAKRRVIDTILTSEFTVLARLLARIAAGHYSTRDYSAVVLREALELYVLYFPVYRTYLTATSVSAGDRALIEATIALARANWPNSDAGIFDFLRDALTLDLIAPGNPPHSKPRVRRFALKVQQFTGPTMAKSLEDTAFYRYHRLLALNEVGGNPATRELPVDAFHQAMADRARHWPHALTTTATHDTKRGEDARARLLSLSELSHEWAVGVGKWKQLNARHITTTGNLRSPSVAHEYMIYQALLGAWPLDGPDRSFVERMQSYVVKAAREGKQESSWINVNEAYERNLQDFIANILTPDLSSEFLESFTRFADRTSLLGAMNTISQLTLKATLPGVPDFYQGTELFDFSLVDPDNRRSVDFEQRRKAFVDAPVGWPDLTAHWRDGLFKLQWTRQLLMLRRTFPDIFTQGSYQPLDVSGPHSDHVVAYARQRRRDTLIVIVCRKFARLTDGGRHWLNVDHVDASIDIADFVVRDVAIREALQSGGALPASLALKGFPAAVLPATIQS
ncbi:malto-oligosyltrehalose synthase [Bradyrhizobium prioriisuperbiae]|uniref:malto-oligosyltrehalose synthase n=1 Tax=Bradyrhizobium prioriisuperbiae TaxID=2854389 RepID=UPI0028E7D1DF|nr:malto-oligosyltrehalose synthase [Bradyrhizobium prioritasuperba]